jgi:hypothetical protein
LITKYPHNDELFKRKKIVYFDNKTSCIMINCLMRKRLVAVREEWELQFGISESSKNLFKG